MTQFNHPLRIALETLGCKLNQAETEQLSRELIEAGYCIVPPNADADAYFLNTCTVTHVADRKSRQILRSWHRQNPGAFILAAGCYPQRNQDELRQIEGIGCVLNNSDKPDLVAILNEHFRRNSRKPTPLSPENNNQRRTRSFISIQSGCSNNCSYCIVPLVRGKERSTPPSDIITAIEQRIAEGYQEIVLTGTEVGAYQYDGINFTGLVSKILAACNIPRLRISSLQPSEITPESLKLWEDKRLCPHFHISLQSGADTVLGRMRRRYTVTGYRQALFLIRSKLPYAAITTDIIVGFPGENDAEFDESYRNCQELGFARIHVFPYSVRPETTAAKMDGQVPAQVVKERRNRMLALAKENSLNFRKQFIGKEMEVLWEQRTARGVWSGLTDNYIRVYADSDDTLTNRFNKVSLMKNWRDGMWSEL